MVFPAERRLVMGVKCVANREKLTAYLAGELDHHNASKIKEEIDNSISQDTKILVLDFKELSFMDSSGIGVIIGRYKKMKRQNGAVYVKNMSGQMEKIFRMSGLDKIIKTLK